MDSGLKLIQHRLSTSLMRAVLLASAGATVFLCAPFATAETYPDRTIHMVLTASAGGGADSVARLVAQGLTGVLGQSVVVENKPDASAIVGPLAVATSKPDGYTILLNASTHVILPHLMKSMPFDADKDFTPITQLGKSPFVLTVIPSRGIGTLAELVQFAKSKPGELRVGVAGIGTPDHIAVELFEKEAQIETLKVPFKGGGPALLAALAGTVDLVMLPPLLIKQHAEAGKLKPLAITGSEQSDAMPGVPTVASLGYPKYEFLSWFGFWGPKGMPQDRVDLLQRAIAKVLASDDVKRRLAEQGFFPVGSTPAVFAAFVKSESARYSAIIKERDLAPR